MRVLVTGATGFIGRHVVLALSERGYAVRALARPSTDVSNLASLAVEIRRGDVLDETSCLDAAAGCDAVLHLAADYRLWARDPGEIERTNVQGTRNVLRAAARAGAARVVHTSSVVALQPSPVDPEPRPADPATLATAYERSKWQADREVEEAARTGLGVVTVYPTMPLGPGDHRPTPAGQMIVDFILGRLPFYVELRLNAVAVEDVAVGHVLALERGRDGEGYILGGQNVTLGDLLLMLAELTGRPAPRAKVPLGLAWLAAAAEDGIAGRLKGRAPRVSFGSVHMARRTLWVSSDKAVTELGMPQTPLKDALRRAVEWFRVHGYAA